MRVDLIRDESELIGVVSTLKNLSLNARLDGRRYDATHRASERSQAPRQRH